MIWPEGRGPDQVSPLGDIMPQASAAIPWPSGRGQWRLTLHWRPYSSQLLQNTGIVELTNARSRKLDQGLNAAATLTFTLNGLDPAAQQLRELAQEVVAWRWDTNTGQDVAMFRGPICQAQDQLTEQSYTINITCHDYVDLYSRRLTTFAAPYTISQMDQDNIVTTLMTWADHPNTAGTPWTTPPVAARSLIPGSYLPLNRLLVDPSGATRGLSTVLRDRSYTGQTTIGEALSNLSAVVNGFDYDVLPGGRASMGDSLRIFYPYQGILRTSPVLHYGTTVSTVDRTVQSANYGNYWRVIGNAGEDANAPQIYGEAYNADAYTGSQGSVGLWMSGDNASDVSIQSTLDAQAWGDLQAGGILVPSYSLGLRPGFYSPTLFQMGDVLPLVLVIGRLNINTNIRVVGISYDIGDDGQEDVSLTVGRPDVTFAQLMQGPVRDINALARR